MKLIRILILALVGAVVISIIFIVFTNRPAYYNDGYYSGLDMYMEQASISIDELNLTDSEISAITNETFKLIIEVENSSGIQKSIYSFYKYGRHNGTYPAAIGASPENEDLFLRENFSYQFNFSLTWVINSTEPAIQNLKLLGDENKITGYFTTDGDVVNVTIDEKYSDLVSVVQKPSYETVIELPFEIKIIMWTQWIVS